MTRDEMIALAKSIAISKGLDPALVCAVCHHESANWQTYAGREEPGFYKKYIEPLTVKRFGVTISETTERRWRATSFGLMQVMGQVARERGFTGEWLTELTNPEVGIEYGCRELKRRLDLAHGDVHSGLLGYNGGGDPAYPSKVLKHYNDYL